jgi:hypothetical protein
MQLTKLRAAPERQAEVPPCAPAGEMDGGTASQLIRGVGQTREVGVSDDDSYSPLTSALEAFRAEYADLSDTWRQLEAKAQGTVAIAGIFLAAAYAFVRDLRAATSSGLLRIGIALAVLLFLASVVLAVLALRVREVQAPPVGDTLRELAEDLMQVSPADRGERMPDFLRDQMRLWPETNADLRKQTEAKAGQVRWAQRLLLFAICVIGIETIILLAGVD